MKVPGTGSVHVICVCAALQWLLALSGAAVAQTAPGTALPPVPTNDPQTETVVPAQPAISTAEAEPQRPVAEPNPASPSQSADKSSSPERVEEAAEAFAADSSGDPGLAFKIYGDTQFQARNRAPVNNTFAAAHLDLFATADVDRLSFLSEVFFESGDNEIAVDVERLQINYLVSNWLRLRAGRTHTAFGYYNDTYHHGNLFELTTGRPFTVQFEDEGGLFVAHLVGVGLDGAFATGIGDLRYDLEVGNGRLADTSAVAIFEAGKNQKLVNARLRLTLNNGLAFGINGLVDKIPSLLATATEPARASIQEQMAGAHVVYMEKGVSLLVESALVRHASNDGPARTTLSVFGELGYEMGRFTPYARVEWIRFPREGDAVYQAPQSTYAATRTLIDLRLGVGFLVMQALVLKIEGERLARASIHQEILTIKAAFGF